MPTGYDYVALRRLYIGNVLAFNVGNAIPNTTVTAQGWVTGVDVAAPGTVTPTPQALTDQGFVMGSSGSGGPNFTDSTARVTIPSYQGGFNNYGEGIRLQLLKPYAKNMIAWQIPLPTQAGDLETYFAMNDSFEAADFTGTSQTGTTGWALVGGATLAVDTSTFVAGTQSGKITWAAGAAGSQAISQPVTGLVIGHTYTFTAWLRSTAGNPTMYLDVDAANPSATIATDGGWYEIATTWTATATSHNVRVVLGATATAGQIGRVDLAYVTPALAATPSSVVWIGAHYEAQDATGLHGHWSLEVPDSSGSLQTRLEVKFADATGKIGLDKTLIQTESSDLVVDTSNAAFLRLRSGAGSDRLIEVANDQWGTSPRWRFGAPGAAETGSSAGSNFGISHYNDANALIGWPLVIKRSNGTVFFGGTSLIAGQTDGAEEGVQINRNHSGNALTINTNLTGGTGATGYFHTPLDTTSRTISVAVTAEATARFVLFADGKHEWGPGGSTARDVNLYRATAVTLASDFTFKPGRYATAGRPAAATAGQGAMYYDTTLSKPAWSDGTNWKDAAGTTV